MKNSVSPADYIDWARLNTSFSAIAAFTDVSVDLTGDGEPEKIAAAGVSAPFFDVFGVRPLLRTHVRSRRRHRWVATASWSWRTRFWRQRFGADPVGGRPHHHAQRRSPSSDRRAAGERRTFHMAEAQILVPLVLQGGIGTTLAHVASVRRLRPPQAGRVDRAVAIGDGSHRSRPRSAIPNAQPRSRRARHALADEITGTRAAARCSC